MSFCDAHAILQYWRYGYIKVLYSMNKTLMGNLACNALRTPIFLFILLAKVEICVFHERFSLSIMPRNLVEETLSSSQLSIFIVIFENVFLSEMK